MALMSDERRKEMEEEMSRFELEIAGPEETKVSSTGQSSKRSKPLSPPPAPPSVSVLIPDVLIKAPPPPPPPLSPSSLAPTTVLRPPPPPPSLHGPPPAASQPPASVRFIPHQLQRQPPKRPPFMTMTGPPSPFPPPGHFGPPQHQAPPMAMPPVGPMPPMGHMSMGPMPPMGHVPTGPPPMHGMSHGMPMPMPHQMGNMGMGLPMPPGFCPPSAIPMSMPGEASEQQYFNTNNASQGEDTDVTASDPPSSVSETSSVVEASPAIYAAPFVKTHSENAATAVSSTNGQTTTAVTTSTNASNVQKINKTFTTKTEESTVGPVVPTTTASEETVVSKKKEKKKKIVRMAGGQAWEDNSLLDWETDDFRIFCGDLGNDVTDEVLIRAFSKYPSFGKAKVIRDKRTNKTKGYGFVSFKDPQDFIKAMREMNGRYVGSRPIKLRKSTWRDRNIEIVKKKQKEKEKLGLL